MTYSAAFLRWAREEADRPYIERDRTQAMDELADVRLDRISAPIDPYTSDRDLCELAQRRADLMLDRVAALCEPVTVEWLNAELAALEARPLAYDQRGGPVADQLAGMVKRVSCPLWWRRQLRRACVRKREAQAQARGLVSVRTGQLYVTDETMRRGTARRARNQAMLEGTELESAEGEIITLWQAVQASTANPAIRRGELMTRIRGAEEWATAAGMVGVFTTNTLPSRFHAQLFKGGANPAYDGSTPKDGQGWLCKTWARARAAFKRRRIRVFGFRVAEPHHDACPHWHMLLWVDAAQAEQLREVMRAYWLAEGGDEKGAQEHRVKFEAIDPAKGGAVAYISKYIAKSIDDAGAVGTEGHRDAYGGDQLELIEGGNKAKRVQEWASAWGIRQFQSIGQPPVTVWRELRRVSELAAQGASQTLQEARKAVHRDGERRACWHAYMQAQGGAMQGRGYRLALASEIEPTAGRYSTSYAPKVRGVLDRLRPGEWVLSDRKQWKARGDWRDSDRTAATWGDDRLALRAGLGLSARPQAAQPWTRFINCTRRGGAEFLQQAGIVGMHSKTGPGGTMETEEWPSKPPSSSPLQCSPLLTQPRERLSSLALCAKDWRPLPISPS